MISAFDWSPEQISNKLKEFGFTSLSPKTICRLVHENKKAGGEWYKRLRICSKRYRKKYGKGYRQEQIPDRICISERSAIVDEKIRIGDWEADTVIGKGHQGAFVTLLERRNRLFLAERIPGKSVTAGLIKLLGQLKGFVHTITFDNGREFSGHRKAVRKMNNRPRKCVVFKSPKQVFLEFAPRPLIKSEVVAVMR